MTWLVGLDVGTFSVRGLAVDERGTVVASAERGYPLSIPRPGWAEQDPDDWWRASADVLDELGGAAALAIGLSGQMHGIVALDARDRPLRPAIVGSDLRARSQAQEIQQRVGERGGPDSAAAKLLWLREHEPEVHGRMRSWLAPKDYVRLRLCGERVTDVTDASTTLLLDVARRRWSAGHAQALDLDPAWLPQLSESTEAASPSRGGVPIAGGAGDRAARALGAGVLAGGGPASIDGGGSASVLAALSRFTADPQSRARASCHAAPGVWSVSRPALSAEGSLRWLRDELPGAPDLDSLLRDAAAWAPGADGLLFAAQLARERAPHPEPSVRGAFVGLRAEHDRGALARAVLEGVAFALRDALDVVGELGGRPRAGRVWGSAARIGLWLEIAASVLDLPLEVCEVDEGGAFGAALLAGVAAGVFADVGEAVTTCVRVQRTVEPRPDWVTRYAEILPRFRRAHPALGTVTA
jgi:xylulokinase